MNKRPFVSCGQLSHKEDSESEIRRAVEEALEPWQGIKHFIQPGQTVLLKPNQTLFMPHKSGSTTSPPLIRVLTEMSFEAGAKEVWVAEASGHAQKTRNVMSTTGMTKGVKKTKAHMIYLDEIAHKIFDFGEDAGELRYMPAPEILERADVIVNVPKAKTHFVDPISCACKNWVGVMPMSFRLWCQRQVDPYYLATALLLKKFRPTLNLVDGIWAGQGQGPGANDPFWWGRVLAGEDPVAMDVTIARLFGLDWRLIRMAKQASELGVGVFDADAVELVGPGADHATYQVVPADPGVDRFPCHVLAGKGATIEGTLGHWKTIADGWMKYGLWKLFTLLGTPTFMFGRIEDPEFEKHLEEGPYLVLDDSALDKYKYDPRVTFVPGSPVPQSYMQNEMIEGMGFSGIYQLGKSVEEMISAFKGRLQSSQ